MKGYFKMLATCNSMNFHFQLRMGEGSFILCTYVGNPLFKWTVAGDFSCPFFSSNEPTWDPDNQAELFLFLAVNLPRYLPSYLPF